MYHEDEDVEEVARALEPSVIEEKLRAAVQLCWYILPRERRSIRAVEGEITGVLARIFRDLKEEAGEDET
jgi:hypothetical protein